MKMCSVANCTHPAKTKGYCPTHYSRVQRYGDPRPDMPVQRKVKQPKLCMTGCGQPVLARGWCATHYQRWRTTGDPGGPELLRPPVNPDETERTCKACGVTKPINDFYRDRNGWFYTCRDCYREQQTKLARQRKYGLDPAAYEVLVKQQDGRCAICKQHKKLVIDHCHRGGQVRALLCDRCNRLLGVADDDIALMVAATEFLRQHQ